MVKTFFLFLKYRVIERGGNDGIRDGRTTSGQDPEKDACISFRVLPGHGAQVPRSRPRGEEMEQDGERDGAAQETQVFEGYHRDEQFAR